MDEDRFRPLHDNLCFLLSTQHQRRVHIELEISVLGLIPSHTCSSISLQPPDHVSCRLFPWLVTPRSLQRYSPYRTASRLFGKVPSEASGYAIKPMTTGDAEILHQKQAQSIKHDTGFSTTARALSIILSLALLVQSVAIIRNSRVNYVPEADYRLWLLAK